MKIPRGCWPLLTLAPMFLWWCGCHMRSRVHVDMSVGKHPTPREECSEIANPHDREICDAAVSLQKEQDGKK